MDKERGMLAGRLCTGCYGIVSKMLSGVLKGDTFSWRFDGVYCRGVEEQYYI